MGQGDRRCRVLGRAAVSVIAGIPAVTAFPDWPRPCSWTADVAAPPLFATRGGPWVSFRSCPERHSPRLPARPPSSREVVQLHQTAEPRAFVLPRLGGSGWQNQSKILSAVGPSQRAGGAEPQVIVPVARLVPVAVAQTGVLRGHVPRATAVHAVDGTVIRVAFAWEGLVEKQRDPTRGVNPSGLPMAPAGRSG